jgi:hypothetical protein
VWVPNVPSHQARYWSIEIPVWWRPSEEPKK